MSEAATVASAIIDLVAGYALIGVAAALAFFALRRLHGPAHFTIGARVLIFPALVALWPFVLRRALAAREER
jgi:hypothetical protein